MQIVVKEKILPRLYLLIPALVLVYFMVSGASLMRSGMMGIITAIILNFVGRFIFGGKYFVAWKELGIQCIKGLKQAAEIAIPTGACGIIIGVVVQSGLATKVSKYIAVVGQTHLIVALLIAMMGCMLLGMALPTVAAYLVSNVLFVPTLVGLGIAPLPANMFVFYFGIMAQITPPVCLASFTAAGIAGAVADYLFTSLHKLERALLLVAAILLIAPEPITDVIGIALGGALAVICFLRAKSAKKAIA